jgi:hypothetical protein
MMVEPMQSEPITTDVVVSNIDQVYSIMCGINEENCKKQNDCDFVCVP